MVLIDPEKEIVQKNKDKVLLAIFYAMKNGQASTGEIYDVAKKNNISTDDIKKIAHLGYNIENGSGKEEIDSSDVYKDVSDNLKDSMFTAYSPVVQQQIEEAAKLKQEDSSSEYPMGPVALSAIGGMLGLDIAGKLVKGGGKWLYSNVGGISPTIEQSLQQKEGRTSFQKFMGIKPKGASTTDVITTTDTALKRGGIFKQTGSNIQRATTAMQTARRIRDTEAQPIIDKIQDIFSLDDIAKEAKNVANNIKNKITATEYAKGVDEVIDTLKQSLPDVENLNINRLTAPQLQDLRSHMMKMDIPQSAYRGTEVKESYKQGAMAIVKAIKNKTLDSVAKIGENVKKFDIAYHDYGNLVNMSETAAKKAGTLPSQNLQQIISSTSGKPLSALSTIVGKVAYKIGQGIEELSLVPSIQRGVKGAINKVTDIAANKVLQKAGKIIKPVGETLAIAGALSTIPGLTPSAKAEGATDNIPSAVKAQKPKYGSSRISQGPEGVNPENKIFNLSEQASPAEFITPVGFGSMGLGIASDIEKTVRGAKELKTRSKGQKKGEQTIGAGNVAPSFIPQKF